MTTIDRIGDHLATRIGRSLADELERRDLDLGLTMQRLAFADSARFVLENIPLHLRKSHYELRRDAVLAGPEGGLFLEFGVWQGHWLTEMARVRDVAFFGFDSFEGLPEAWSIHRPGLFDLGGVLPEMPANVTLVKGWFSDTLPRFLDEHSEDVAFVHVDCDLYSSTKTVFDLLAPRFVPGSQIVLDDFMMAPGWQRAEHRAFFDFIAAYGWDFEYTGYSSEFPACSAAVALTARG